MNNKLNTITGFTLIEVLIALVIIAILASIAVPSYQNSVIKAKRSAAKTALLSVASKQETYRMENKTYIADLTELGYPANPYFVDEDNNILNATAGSIYQISAVADANTFTITATPQNTQTADTKCANFTLDQLGAKGVSGTLSANDCW